MSMMMRRGMMVPKAPGGLPDEYLRVQYIESTGTQWIDTGYVPNNYTCVETQIKATTTEQNIPVFGIVIHDAQTQASSLGTYPHVTPYNLKWYYGMNNTEGNGGTYSKVIGDVYHIVYNSPDNTLVINDTTIGNISAVGTYYGNSLGISGRGHMLSGNSSFLKFGKWQYYYFKIYDNGTLIRDMIPCIRIADSKPGMFDLVGRQFYVNQGTGEFIVGNSSNFYLENKAITQTKEYLDLKLLDKDEAFTVLCDYEVTSGYSETFSVGLDAFSCGETNGNFNKAIRIGNFSSYAMAYLNGQGPYKSPTSVSDLRTVCAIRYDPSQSNNVYSQLAGKNPVLRNVTLTLSEAYADVGGVNGTSRTGQQDTASGIIHGLYVYKRALTDQQISDFVNNGTVP